MALLHSNNYTTSLTSSITDVATTIPVASVAKLPAIGGGDTCYLTLQNGSTIEIVLATSVSSLNITVTRAQQSTSASAFASGSIVSLRPTANSFDRKADGASSSTDNALPRFDGTTGKILQGSSVIVDDSNNITGVVGLTATGNIATSQNILAGYTSTATAAGTTTLTVSSTQNQIFTGSTTQTVTMPVVSTLTLGTMYRITNLSTGIVTVQSSGANSIQAMQANSTLILISNATSGTGASVWHVLDYTAAASGQTGSGSLVRATSPTLVTPALGTPASGTLTNCATSSSWPFVNLIADNGRFDTTGATLTDYSLSGSFQRGNILAAYNSSTSSDLGKYIWNNSTYGGAAGALSAGVDALIIAMGRSGTTARFGVEFRVLTITAGSGTTTSVSFTSGTKYLMTVNGSKPMFSFNKKCTFVCWARAGTNNVGIKTVDALYINGVLQSQSPQYELTPASGWVHLRIIHSASIGYDNEFPKFYATNGTTLDIGCAAIFSGEVDVGIHTAPLIGQGAL